MKETLGDRIARARRDRGLANRDLAAAAGVNVNTVSKWITGGQRPGSAALGALANVLNVSADWLLHGGDQLAAPTSQGRKKLPARAYARIYEYLGLMKAAGIPDQSISEAERHLADQDFGQHHAHAGEAEAEEEILDDIDAMWAALKVVYSKRWGIQL